MTRARLSMFAVALSVMLFAVAASASAATPAPAWKLFQVSQPTNFSPGTEASEGGSLRAAPAYFVSVTNVGGASTSGPIDLEDTLPSGITPSTLAPPIWRVYKAGTGSQEPCEVTGQSVSCQVTAEVVPGAAVEVRIPVDVTAAPSTPILENHVAVSGGDAEPVSGSTTTAITSEVASFGFLSGESGLSGGAVTEAGSAASVAGSHPFSVVLAAGFPTRMEPAKPEALAAGAVRDLAFSLPPGLVANPNGTPVRCTETQLLASQNFGEGCPPASQIGTMDVYLSNFNGGETLGLPLYNMVPPPGVPAELAFNLEGTFVHIMGGLDGAFHLIAESRDILAKVAVGGVIAELWGDPSDPRHDQFREGQGCTHCSVEPFKAAFLTMPSACSSSLDFAATADSWEDPTLRSRSAVFGGPNSEPVRIEGCESLQFAPTMNVQATSGAADAPTGLSVHLHLPQNEGIKGRATATLKKVSVQLPEGITVNPSAADGLGACSPLQIGLGNNEPAACADSSKVGTAEIVTPLLNAPLKGSIYLAEQDNNPFSTLLAVYLVVEGEGIVIKLPGRVDVDPSTGRVVATFDNNPQLPFSDLQVDFNSGPRAALTTPSVCGTYGVRSELTSWASSTPVVTDSPIVIGQGCGGGGFEPALQAGTTNPVAGSYSPFTLRVTRQDGEQNISRITSTLPEGLLAKIAGIPLCPDAQAASGDCPAASQVGTTTAGVGAGTQPLYIPQPGKSPTAVYLAGPYNNAPFSLVVKVPAQAGPFDLGTIAVRVALSIDPHTAQVTASSDPLPQILDGIPIAYRDVRVSIDREGFMINPTSCNPMQITSSLLSVNGATANPSSRFQVAGCGSLAFKPSFQASTQAKTSKANGASLSVTVASTTGQANIAKVHVVVPKQLPARLTTLQKACTDVQFNANPAGCPAASLVGTAVAYTPLLNVPLTGPGYLVSHGGAAFPDLVFVLQGEGVVLDLDGNTDIKKGITTETFNSVPDAPITRFETTFPEGPHSVLATNIPASAKNSLCGQALTMPTTITGQNGTVIEQQTKIAVSGCPKTKTLTRAQKLAIALKVCHKKPKGSKRTSCERTARKKYGPLKKAKKKTTKK
jgi:hypothetical protein